MLSVFISELKNRKINLIAYCVIGLALLWIYIALFPSIKDSSAQLDKLIQSYPKEFFRALGIQDLSFDTIEKFMSMELFTFEWPILAIVFALSRAGGALAGEIEKGTMGLYLSLPVSRLRLFMAKYAAGIVSFAVLIVFTIVSAIPMAALYNIPINVMLIMKLSLLSFLFMWAIFAVAIFLSALSSERSKVYMLMGGGLLLMYAANVIAALKTNLSWLHNLSIFNYYNAQDVLAKGDLKVSFVLVFVAIIILFSAAGALAFSKRDVAN